MTNVADLVPQYMYYTTPQRGPDGAWLDYSGEFGAGLRSKHILKYGVAKAPHAARRQYNRKYVDQPALPRNVLWLQLKQRKDSVATLPSDVKSMPLRYYWAFWMYGACHVHAMAFIKVLICLQGRCALQWNGIDVKSFGVLRVTVQPPEQSHLVFCVFNSSKPWDFDGINSYKHEVVYLELEDSTTIIVDLSIAQYGYQDASMQERCPYYTGPLCATVYSGVHERYCHSDTQGQIDFCDHLAQLKQEMPDAGDGVDYLARHVLLNMNDSIELPYTPFLKFANNRQRGMWMERNPHFQS